jgi:hypothetical protein
MDSNRVAPHSSKIPLTGVRMYSSGSFVWVKLAPEGSTAWIRSDLVTIEASKVDYHWYLALVGSMTANGTMSFWIVSPLDESSQSQNILATIAPADNPSRGTQPAMLSSPLRPSKEWPFGPCCIERDAANYSIGVASTASSVQRPPTLPPRELQRFLSHKSTVEMQVYKQRTNAKVQEALQEMEKNGISTGRVSEWRTWTSGSEDRATYELNMPAIRVHVALAPPVSQVSIFRSSRLFCQNTMDVLATA